MSTSPNRDSDPPAAAEQPSGPPERSFWLADLAIRQPVFITMIALAVMVVGIISYARIGLDLFPDVSLPIVVIQTVYAGAGPTEVEQAVSEPIEDAVIGLNGVDTVRSTSTAGASLVLIEFAMDQDPKAAADAVRARLNLIQNRLPTDALTPTVATFDPSAAPILSVAIADRGGRRSPAELRAFADQVVKSALERTPGVAAVNVSGGPTTQIQVDLQSDRLRNYGLAPDRVVQAIHGATLNLPAGTIPQGSQDALLRTSGPVQSPAQLADLPVSTLPNGTIIRVRDLAGVSEGTSEIQSLSRLNGNGSVIVSVQKQGGANTVEVAEAVKTRLADLMRQNPDLIAAVAFDQSTYTRESIDELQSALLLGALLAGLVVLLFFRDLRNVLVTVAGLPVILLGTVAALRSLGVTMNMISMLAMSLSVGMLIDDAIVVRENIFRHVERGVGPRVAAARGAAEIAPAVFAVTATIVAVFLPIGFTEGIAGKFLRDFGLTVAVAVLISLVEAFTLAPMLSAHFFRPIDLHRPATPGPAMATSHTFTARLSGGYRHLLRWALGHRWVIVLAALLSLAVSGAVFGQLAFSFVPASDQGVFTISLDLPPGTPLAESDRLARAVEGVARADGAVAHVFTTVGSSNGAANQARIIVSLAQPGDTAATIARLRPRIQAVIPKTSFAIDAQSDSASLGSDAAAGALQGRPIQFEIRGDDAATVERVSAELVTKMRTIPGLTDVDRSTKPGAPGLAVTLDADKAAKDGLSAGQVGAILRAMVSGESAGTLTVDGKETEVIVRLAPADRARAADLLKLPIATPRGSTVQLSEIGSLTQEIEPGQIDRVDRQRVISVGAAVEGRGQGAALADAQVAVKELRLPPGVTIEASGQTAYTTQMTNALGLAMGLAVLFVYMVLASLFGSFVQPFIIMLALPFSLLGALLAIWLAGFDFDMLGMIGMILLMGLVTKNSILLVDLANGLRRAGSSGREAMLVAGPIRLRPILMTTLAMIGGMIPVALGVGAGAEVRRPMGITVIGGLLTSTLLTLIVVPVVYTLVADAGGWLRRRFSPLARERDDSAFNGWKSGATAWGAALLLLGALVWQAARTGGSPTPTAPAQPSASATLVTAPTMVTIPPSASPPATISAAPESAGSVPSVGARSRPTPATLPSAAVPAVAAADTRVANTAGLGLNLRGAPGLDHPAIAILPEGSALVALGQATSAGGQTWVKVRDAQGRVGWVAQDYLAGGA